MMAHHFRKEVMRKILLALTFMIQATQTWGYVPLRSLHEPFLVGAEWIYFSPASESVSYAILASGSNPTITPLNQEIIENRLDDFYSGYRVFGAYALCEQNIFIAGRYTHLSAKHSSSIEVPIPTAFPPTETVTFLLLGPSFSNLFGDFASDIRTFSYTAADGIVGFPCLCCPNFFFYVFAGAHYAEITTKDSFVFRLPPAPGIPFNELIFGNLKNKFWGVGPLIGVRGEKCLGNCFSLQGTVSGSVVIGKTTDQNINTVIDFLGGTSDVSTISAKGLYRGVPYGNVNVGANYSFFYPCCDHELGFILEVGYEAMVYYKALAELRDLGLFDDTSYHNVTMHGPYLSLTVNF